MAKTEFIRARVDKDLKEKTEYIFATIGLNMTDAVTLFLKQCELHNGLPFEVRIPNELTRKVMDDTDKGIDVHHCDNLADMLKELDAD